MIEDAVRLLTSLGITIDPGNYLLNFIGESVREEICNRTNQKTIPDGLRFLAVEMIVGKFLLVQKDSGTLKAETLDLSAAVKQIKEGDTDISFGIGEGSKTPEQRLDELIAHLTSDRSQEFLRYRRFVW